MPDYSKLTDKELCREISKRREWVTHDWLSDKAATWDALVEMPLSTLAEIAGTYVIWCDGDGIRIPAGEDVKPARAVWCAWCGWMDSKETRYE